MAGTAVLSSSPSVSMLLGKKRSIRDTGDDDELSMDVASSCSTNYNVGSSCSTYDEAAAYGSSSSSHHQFNSFGSAPSHKRYKALSHEAASPMQCGFRFPSQHASFVDESNNNSFGRFGAENMFPSSPLTSINANKMPRFSDTAIEKVQNIEDSGNSRLVRNRSAASPVMKVDFNQQKYHESLVLSLKTEFEIQLRQKQQEMERMVELNNNLQQENANIKANSHQSAHMVEENRILKKAVGIQDHRFKELTAQCEQQQQMLGAAMEHIAQLERANRELATQFNHMHYGGDGFPQPPPDVF